MVESRPAWDWLCLLSPWFALICLVIWDTREKGTWRTKLKDPLTLFTAILAFSTVVLAYVAYLQWGTLEKTDQTLRLQSRAWIAPRGLTAPENFKAAIDKYTEVTLRLENVGKEPAINTAEVVATEALPIGDFRNDKALRSII